jgi:hypothetical protein
VIFATRAEGLLCASDKRPFQVLCKVAPRAAFPLTLVFSSLLAVILSPAVLVQGASPRSVFLSWKAVLRKVVHRKPIPFLQHPEHEFAKDFLGVYVVETLECNHQLTTFPQADPLVAVRRRCNECEEKVVPISAPKKGPSSVGGGERESVA